MSTITKLSPDVTQYYKNITFIDRRKCENTKSSSMNSTNNAHEFTERKLRGAWKDRASDGLLEIHATAALLRSATRRIQTLQAPKP